MATLYRACWENPEDYDPDRVVWAADTVAEVEQYAALEGCPVWELDVSFRGVPEGHYEADGPTTRHWGQGDSYMGKNYSFPARCIRSAERI